MPKHKNYIHNPSNTPSVSSAVKGQKGSQGTRGIDGRKGERGPQGSAGLDGHTTTIVGSFKFADPSTLPKSGTIPVGWDDGINPPIPFSLEVGEAIIDLRTDDLWCFTPASNIHNWTKLGKLAGPRGMNGADGPRGYKGSNGIPGADGLDGIAGPSGEKGEKGTPGRDGDEGPKGQNGVPGKNGTNGNNGLKGVKGETGSPGLNGSQGIPGSTGADGEKGSKGSTGSPGPRGLPGQRGIKGDTVSSVLVPRVGGTVNFANAGLHDRHNISRAVLLEDKKLRVYFGTPFEDTHYTVITTTQTGNPEDLLNTAVVEKTTTYVTLSLRHADTGIPVGHGIASLVIYRFNS
jgi:hypothetical protein